MSDYDGVYIEERPLGEIAREEIDAARRDGVDPMDIARTHQRLGYIIPKLIEQEGESNENV